MDRGTLTLFHPKDLAQVAGGEMEPAVRLRNAPGYSGDLLDVVVYYVPNAVSGDRRRQRQKVVPLTFLRSVVAHMLGSTRLEPPPDSGTGSRDYEI
jgi:hypothetical protein